ncbi:hypothetical protein LK08_00525 [Streptomyces sp. MUSC 125]|nr:hypothetical protein LK08_00525 [Streptomyces sp. MUSC 125]
MTRTMPPHSDSARRKLECQADALLEAAGDENWGAWPALWPQREEAEFERIAAAHTGMVPLRWVPVMAALPTFDPDSKRRDLECFMQERPGAQEPDHYGELLSLLSQAEEASARYGSGFTVERRSDPPDSCQWPGCCEPLYASQAPRKRGRPRKYCPAHQKTAKTRRKAHQRRGVLVGRNRNLVYDFEGLEEQDLSGYRELWGQINTTGR